MGLDQRLWPVILSGGVGSRLWPLSRAVSPKQLLALSGPLTMIQATALRVADETRFERPIVVAGEAHGGIIARQLAEIGRSPEIALLEPSGRNTAPAIALAAFWLETRGLADQPMLVMPSDHVISDVPAFLRAVTAAEPYARDRWLVTFGIRARTPETGYGYIKLGGPLGSGVRRAEAFVEKPAPEIAREYVLGGRHAWNGGIFLMRPDRYLAELAAHAPEIYSAVRSAVDSAGKTGAELRPQAAAWERCPSDSIDYAVMERASEVAVAAADMGWSDVGSWDALHAIAARDASENMLQGETLTIDCHDCLIRSEGPLIAAVGLSHLSVIATPDAVLVMPRGRAQDVKKVVDGLKSRRPDLL